MTQVKRTAEEEEDYIYWALEVQDHGMRCLRALILGFETGSLQIDPDAWNNTMKALEWFTGEEVAGRLRATTTKPQQKDLDLIVHVRVAGAAAIDGLPIDELSLARDAGIILARYGFNDWRELYKDLPACYPLPEELFL